MKIAATFLRGIKQITLTPENDHEKRVLDLLKEPADLSVEFGDFGMCRNGYVRHFENAQPDSAMIILRDQETPSE